MRTEKKIAFDVIFWAICKHIFGHGRRLLSTLALLFFLPLCFVVLTGLILASIATQGVNATADLRWGTEDLMDVALEGRGDRWIMCLARPSFMMGTVRRAPWSFDPHCMMIGHQNQSLEFCISLDYPRSKVWPSIFLARLGHGKGYYTRLLPRLARAQGPSLVNDTVAIKYRPRIPFSILA